jgi:hypothetical protein
MCGAQGKKVVTMKDSQGKRKKIQVIQIIVALIAMCVANFAFLSEASAGTLTHSSVLELGGASNVNPMIASDGQSLAIDFTTASAGATTVTVDFGSWGGTVNATQSVATNGCTSLFSGSTALPGSLTAAGSGSVVTISSVTALSSSTNYCTELTSTTAVTNPGAGIYPVIITAGSDSQTDSVDILSSGSNVYSITGTIVPTFTMSLSGTTDTFSGNLASGSTTISSGITTTINTNAASGWFLWAEDSQAGLHSTTAATTIPTVTTGSNQTMNSGSFGPGHNAFGLAATSNNTANYAYNGGTTGGGLSSSAFNEIATSASPASSVTVLTKELTNISATTPPATDYTDTITLIGAGSF